MSKAELENLQRKIKTFCKHMREPNNEAEPLWEADYNHILEIIDEKIIQINTEEIKAKEGK